MIYRVEIRDKSFNLLEILEDEILSLSWDYSRIGGCGSFRFTLPREYCDEKHISGDFNIRIYIRNSATKAYDLWYQGFVENKIPKVVGQKETVEVSGHGYFAQLDRYYVSGSYASQEISVAVKSILDNYVTTPSDISYDAPDIVATTYSISSTGLNFNTNARNALQTLADLAGTREWGVDKDRKFFFKARSSTAGFRFPLGGPQVRNFTSDQSFQTIVNRVIVQGAEVGGTPFTRTVNDASSQTKYGRRDKVYINSAVLNNDDADQLGNSILAEFSEVTRRSRCDLVNYETRVEATIPIPLFVLQQVGTTYGTKLYGTFLYAGHIQRQVNRIQYRIDKNNILIVSLTLGQLKPHISEEIKRIEHELEQLRSDSL